MASNGRYIDLVVAGIELRLTADEFADLWEHVDPSAPMGGAGRAYLAHAREHAMARAA